MFFFLLEKKAINMVELKQYKKIYREKSKAPGIPRFLVFIATPPNGY